MPDQRFAGPLQHPERIAPVTRSTILNAVSKTMQALVKTPARTGTRAGGGSGPEVGPNDVLIRVQKASICGTDVHIYNWDAWAQKTIPVPMVIGHEFVGVIDQVGERRPRFYRAKLSQRKDTSFAVIAGTAWPGGGIFVRTRRGSASIVRAASRNMSRCRAQISGAAIRRSRSM